jgi:hypothetical protein
MAASLVPDNFTVPEGFVADGYRLEMLTPAVAELDYQAVMDSRESLRAVFSANDSWPADDLTLADNVRDLRQHEAEFHAREAFAYTVLTPGRDLCLGCVYIYPSTVGQYDCEMYLWVRSSARDLDEKLHSDMRAWLHSHWPFEQPALPGREIPWKQWHGTRHA